MREVIATKEVLIIEINSSFVVRLLERQNNHRRMTWKLEANQTSDWSFEFLRLKGSKQSLHVQFLSLTIKNRFGFIAACFSGTLFAPYVRFKSRLRWLGAISRPQITPLLSPQISFALF